MVVFQQLLVLQHEVVKRSVHDIFQFGKMQPIGAGIFLLARIFFVFVLREMLIGIESFVANGAIKKVHGWGFVKGKGII